MIENQERQPIVTNYRNPRATHYSHMTGNPRETSKTDYHKRMVKRVPFWQRAGRSLERRPQEWSLRAENVEKQVNEVGAENEEEDKEEEDEGKAKEENEQDDGEEDGYGRVQQDQKYHCCSSAWSIYLEGSEI